jgi:hypothetical protein
MPSICPHCKQQLDEIDLEEMDAIEANQFKTDAKFRLSRIPVLDATWFLASVPIRASTQMRTSTSSPHSLRAHCRRLF